MNSKTQAQKGFKTFIITLFISVVVFSFIYYLINSSNPEVSTQRNSLENSSFTQENYEVATLGETSKRSPFGDLASNNPVDTSSGGQVLSDADTLDEDFDLLEEESLDEEIDPETVPIVTTQTLATEEVSESTVPETGIFGPTVGVLITIILLGLAAYIFYLGPRKLALSSFEKDILDDLD